MIKVPPYALLLNKRLIGMGFYSIYIGNGWCARRQHLCMARRSSGGCTLHNELVNGKSDMICKSYCEVRAINVKLYSNSYNREMPCCRILYVSQRTWCISSLKGIFIKEYSLETKYTYPLHIFSSEFL